MRRRECKLFITSVTCRISPNQWIILLTMLILKKAPLNVSYRCDYSWQTATTPGTGLLLARAVHDANHFFLTMLRQHSQYDSRLGFSFRVLVRVMVRLGLGLGLGLGLVLGLWLWLRFWVRVRVMVDFRVGVRIRVNLTLT